MIIIINIGTAVIIGQTHRIFAVVLPKEICKYLWYSVLPGELICL